MKEQTKTTRVRVLRPFYVSREKLAKVGELVEVETGLAGGLISARKAEAVTETHVAAKAPTVAATPKPATAPAKAPETKGTQS